MPEQSEIQKIVNDSHSRPVLDNPHEKYKNKYLSYFLMIVSCILWVTGFIYANENDFNPIQTSIIRGFMITFVSVGFCFVKQIQLNIKESKLYWQVWKRNALFLMQGLIITLMQFYLPLGILHTLGITGAIFVSVHQYIFQNKTPHARQIIAILLTLIGIALTANGNIISKWINPFYQFNSSFAHYKSEDPKTMAFYSIIFAGFMAFWSYGVYSTGRMNVSPYVINAHFGIKLYLISSLIYPYIGLQSLQTSVFKNTFYIGLVECGLLLALAELCFVVSLVISQNIGMTMMMCACNSLVGYFVSIVRYHQKINEFCVLGTVLIVAGLFVIMLHS